jgi:iron(III) transport system permease protein
VTITDFGNAWVLSGGYWVLAAIPGMVLGLAYVPRFNDPGNPFTFLYGTLAIVVLCNIFHYHTQG